jgi:undecaprenyl-diphosphatase
VSWIGFAIQSIVLISLVAILLGTLGLRWEAIVSILAGVSSGALNTLVKIVIRRPRPTEDLVHVFQSLNSYSFPSGHTMFYMTFFGFLLFLAFVLLKHSWKRRLLISRMYLGEHWGSDVLAGYLLGSLTLILTIQIYHWGKKRYVVEQPVAPENTAPKPTKQVLQEDLKITPRIPVTSEKAEKHEHRADRTKPK